ncbi:MAG TPA: DUF4112 domain-containing protein [Candidatus Limnocylindria bacterium]|nr:DUF4112 domain-containing protein [Candidatus Limnocylindria bacterium]
MDRVTRLPRTERDRSRSLAEVEAMAWLLDNSIPVPGTGRRFGIDAIVGLVPVVGDIVSAGMGLFVVWRASRMGLPRIVVMRMLSVSAVDFAIGSIPLIGDAFDLWFKANTRNLALLRLHIERPETSTRNDWMVVTGLLAIVVAIVAVIGWLLVSLVAAVIGLFS